MKAYVDLSILNWTQGNHGNGQKQTPPQWCPHMCDTECMNKFYNKFHAIKVLSMALLTVITVKFSTSIISLLENTSALLQSKQ